MKKKTTKKEGLVFLFFYIRIYKYDKFIFSFHIVDIEKSSF